MLLRFTLFPPVESITFRFYFFYRNSSPNLALLLFIPYIFMHVAPSRFRFNKGHHQIIINHSVSRQSALRRLIFIIVLAISPLLYHLSSVLPLSNPCPTTHYPTEQPHHRVVPLFGTINSFDIPPPSPDFGQFLLYNSDEVVITGIRRRRWADKSIRLWCRDYDVGSRISPNKPGPK